MLRGRFLRGLRVEVDQVGVSRRGDIDGWMKGYEDVGTE